MRIATLPVIAGIAYEFNRYAGKHENRFVKILRAPGLFMQRFTTKEPDDGMIEVAITALSEALKLDEMPDYSSKSPDLSSQKETAEDRPSDNEPADGPENGSTDDKENTENLGNGGADETCAEDTAAYGAEKDAQGVTDPKDVII